MRKLFIKPENIIPGILLDPESGKLKFYGKSCPSDAAEYYLPVFAWIDEYMKNPKEKTVLEFYLSYFNTPSAMVILQIMNKMESLSKLGKDVTIRWFYSENDEILKDAGEDYKTIIDVKFEIIPLKSTEDENDEMLFDLPE